MASSKQHPVIRLAGKHIPLLLIAVVVLAACVARKPNPAREQPTHRLPTDTARYSLNPSTLAAASISNLTRDTILSPQDSLLVRADSTSRGADSLRRTNAMDINTVAIVDSVDEEPDLDAIVDFSAEDSIILLGRNKIYFFGKSKVDYEGRSINSNYMRMNVDSSTVYAQYVLDSLGHATALPEFKDGAEAGYQARTMTYNFKTDKGYITGVVTKQGEGYVSAERTKKMPDNVMFMEGGRYTTCDHHDHPHFYIHLTKAKVRPSENIVTGPAYMVIADVPLYFLGLPFGYFPFTSKYSSGVIFPSYGEEQARGFFLRNGGYYFAFNDYIDLALTGEIYSKGSWGVSARSSYRKRYKFNGSFEAGYLETSSGYKFEQTHTKQKDFHINWTHSQDPKANPAQTFSASVNFSTSSYDHNAVSSIYSTDRYAQNTKSSSISYSRRFAGTPFSISGSFDITQRTADSTIAMTLPNLNIAMSTIYPFKRAKRVGGERWYEKIQMGYSGQFRNSIQTKENKLLQSNLIRDWQNGMMHSIPLSATFTLFDYVQVTPSISYRERWYTKKEERSYNPEFNRVMPSDTTYGFYRNYDFSTSIGFSTTVYGFFKPWRWLFGDKIQMIRHRMSPTISFSWMPDFSAKPFDFYQEVNYTDKEGKYRTEKYSPYAGGIFGYPGAGKQGSVRFSFANNVEAKIRSKADSTGFRKQSLIDNFQWDIDYNMAADSLKWSDISASLSLRLSPTFTLNLRGLFETYLYGATVDADGRVYPYKSDRLRILNGKGFGRLRSTGTSFSYTFNNSTLRKIAALFAGKSNEKKDGHEDDVTRSKSGESGAAHGPDALGAYGSERNTGVGTTSEYDSDGYLLNAMPWSLSLSYSMSLNYAPTFNLKRMEYDYRLTHNISFNGNFSPAPNWAFTFNGNYNFDVKRITDFRFNVTRDMHCWQLSASVIPLGYIKSYSLTIAVKSSLLKDLKWDQSSYPRRSSSEWY